jgi:hypothetical protein
MLTIHTGERHKFNVIRDLFWTPFDNRFNSLLERLRDHQELFELEMRFENEKSFKLFIDKAERFIDKADELIEYQNEQKNNPKERKNLEEDSAARYST